MERLCNLRAAIGSAEECPRGWCAFWEKGGVVAGAGCALERMGVDFANRDLAYYLNDLRRALESARDEEASAAARRDLSQLVPPDLSGS
jgi:hypothetical protein